MTERLALGITVGASISVAVATSARADDFASADAAHADSGARTLVHPTVIGLSADAAPVFGAAAFDPSHPVDVRIDGFVERVGDPVGMLAEDGSEHVAADLMAAAVACLVDESVSTAGRSADAVVVCHPGGWSARTVGALREALTGTDHPEVELVPEPIAAARWSTATHGDAAAVLVFDLGASGLTVSVVRPDEGRDALIMSLRDTDIAGAEFDLLTMRYVLANALDGIDFDPFDPRAEHELSLLRDGCRKAKESLSINTATVVTVGIAGGTQIRLIRDELEELLRGPLRTALDLAHEAVRRADLRIGDLDRILLTGGGAAIPLVTEMLSTEFGLPVAAAVEPTTTAARGAALIAAGRAESETATTPHLRLVPRPVDDPAPPPAPAVRSTGLPVAEEPVRSGGRRTAVIASAVVLLGLLATGTVAIGTGLGSTPTPPASTDSSVSSVEAGAPGTKNGATVTDGPVADPTGTGSTVPSGAAAPTGAGAPTRAAQSAADGTQPTADGTGPVEAGQPGAPQDGRAPAAEPAPAAPGSPDQPAPQPQPQPQPQPTTIYPFPSPPTQLPTPKTPTLPTGVLSDTIDGVGGAVESVIEAPGQILGGNGG